MQLRTEEGVMEGVIRPRKKRRRVRTFFPLVIFSHKTLSVAACGADTLPVYSMMPAADRPPTRLFRFRSTGAHSLPFAGWWIIHCGTPKLSSGAAVWCCCLGWKGVGRQKKGGVVRVAVLLRFENQTRGVRKEPSLLRETY